MDDNAEQQLTEKSKDKPSQKTVGSLLDESESQLPKQKQVQAGTADDSDHPVEQAPLLEDATKQLNDIELALESIQPQIKLTLEKSNNTKSTLPTSKDCSVIQSEDTPMEVATVSIKQQVGQSDDKNGQNEAKLNRADRVLVNGTRPDDLYLHLMSVMGVQECLLSNRLVCRLWNKLVLERCRKQPSLKLFESFDSLTHYGEMLLKYDPMEDASLILKSVGDDLIFENPGVSHLQLLNMLRDDGESKREASKVLTSVFPKVTQLVLCTEPRSLINIEHFLQFYAKQLISLAMTNYGLWVRNDRPGSKLRAINIPNLKSLHTFAFSPEDGQLLSLLPQLESLTLFRTEISLETFLRAGTQLRELNIHWIVSVYTTPVNEFSKRPRISSNLRKLSLNITRNVLPALDDEDDEDEDEDEDDHEDDGVLQALEFISRNLTSLECLKLYFDCFFDCGQVNRRLHLVTSFLVPLHRLHSLTLQAPVSFFLLDDNQLAQILPLPSVRQLTLQLSDYDSFSMDLFSRAIFAAFPKVEKIRIAFAGHFDGRVNTATFAAFAAFASQHPNVVQLFRSRCMSRFTNLPNAVSPLLGHRRQMYEKYIEEEEQFGMF